MVLAVTPLVGYLLLRLLERPVLAFLGVFAVNYFIMGLTRYIPGIQGGIVMDGLVLLTLILILFRSRDRAVDWSGARNLLTLLSGIWLVYCILLVFNPATTLADWAAGIRGLAVYLFIFPLLTAVLFNRYKYLKTFVFVWSILTLLAVFKALIQKYIGFDPAEKTGCMSQEAVGPMLFLPVYVISLFLPMLPVSDAEWGCPWWFFLSRRCIFVQNHSAFII